MFLFPGCDGTTTDTINVLGSVSTGQAESQVEPDDRAFEASLTWEEGTEVEGAKSFGMVVVVDGNCDVVAKDSGGDAAILPVGETISMTAIPRGCSLNYTVEVEVLVPKEGVDKPASELLSDDIAASETFTYEWALDGECDSGGGGGDGVEFNTVNVPRGVLGKDCKIFGGNYLNQGESVRCILGSENGTHCFDFDTLTFNDETTDATEFINDVVAGALGAAGCTLLVVGNQNGSRTYTTTSEELASSFGSLNQCWDVDQGDDALWIQDVSGVTKVSVDSSCNPQYERLTNALHLAPNEVMLRSFPAGGANWVDLILNTVTSEVRAELVTRTGPNATASLDGMELGTIVSADAAQLGDITLCVATSGDDGGVTVCEIDETSITKVASWTCSGGAYDVNSREDLDGSVSFICASQSGPYRVNCSAGGAREMVKLDGAWTGGFYAATAVVGTRYYNALSSSTNPVIEISKSDAPLTGTVVPEDD
jgi:hypothetical protein